MIINHFLRNLKPFYYRRPGWYHFGMFSITQGVLPLFNSEFFQGLGTQETSNFEKQLRSAAIRYLIPHNECRRDNRCCYCYNQWSSSVDYTSFHFDQFWVYGNHKKEIQLKSKIQKWQKSLLRLWNMHGWKPSPDCWLTLQSIQLNIRTSIPSNESSTSHR